MAAKYIEIARQIKKELRLLGQSGSSRLPSEEEFSKRFDCSRQTVRAALAMLEEEGLIVKKRGSGSYIADDAVGKSRQIAFIVPDRNEYIYPNIIRDLRYVIESSGYTLSCYSTENRFIKERNILTRLYAERPAGIIIEAVNNVLPCMNTDIINRINDEGIPLLYMHNSYDVPKDAVCVGQDNFGGGYELVRYLAKKGHKRIAGIMKCDVVSGLERYRGCVQACLDLGLDFRESNFYWFSAEMRTRLLDSSSNILNDFIQYFLSPCTAVICYNDEIAYRLIRVMQSASIDIPEKMAVVSFDNSYYCTSGDLGITSLGHDARAIGTQTAQVMLSMISGKKCRSVNLPWSITERESSAKKF